VALALAAAAFLATAAQSAPIIWWQVDDGPTHYLHDWTMNADGRYFFEFSERTSSYSIQGVVAVDEDPYIAWGLSVMNSDEDPTTFTTGVINEFFDPIDGGIVYASYSGSVTDIGGDGVTLTPTHDKIQRSWLNGGTSMGVDVGDAYSHGPGVPGASYVAPPDSEGPKHGPDGLWTSMQLEAEFTLSSMDIATVNGFARISPIPEPGTLLLLGAGLAGLAAFGLRRRAG